MPRVQGYSKFSLAFKRKSDTFATFYIINYTYISYAVSYDYRRELLEILFIFIQGLKKKRSINLYLVLIRRCAKSRLKFREIYVIIADFSIS